MDAHPRCGIAGSRTYNYDGTVQQSVGEFDTWAGAFLRSSSLGRVAAAAQTTPTAPSLRGFGYDEPRRVDLAIGAALAIRRVLMAEIGPFDERFFLYHEGSTTPNAPTTRAGRRGSFLPAKRCTRGWAAPAASTTSKRASSAPGASTGSSTTAPLWYYALTGALVGRYALYAGVVAGAVVLGRRLRPKGR